MSKAEKYLYERVDLLSTEKATLMMKVKDIDLEIEETDYEIKELKKSIDDAFDVFSPRTKKSNFVKNEIEQFERTKEELSAQREQYHEQIEDISRDIDAINEALSENEIKEFEIYEKNSSVADETDSRNDADVTENIIVKNNVSSEAEESYQMNGINFVKEQEYERKRIARELHDSTVQMLTNLVHKCEICSKFIDVDAIRTKLELEVMSKTLKDTINDLRNVIYNLRPMSFDDMGLEITFNKIVSQAKRDSDIDIKLQIKGEKKDIDEIQAITLVRVLQEAISNSKKYSKAKIINVELIYDKEYVTVAVKDDGIGFDKSNIKRPEENELSGFGLSMMKERVCLLDGKLRILSEPGKGTEITVTLPC